MRRDTAVVLFSGGLDSGVLAHKLLQAGKTVIPLFIDYGHLSRDNEWIAVDELWRFFSRRYPRLIRKPICLELPLGDVAPSRVTGAAWDARADSNVYNLVPGRNTYLLMAAATLAVKRGASSVQIAVIKGSNRGDHTPEFIAGIRKVVFQSYYHPPRIVAPFVRMTKREVVALGKKLGFPFQHVWTCYVKGSPCGVCSACVQMKASGAAKLRRDMRRADLRRA